MRQRHHRGEKGEWKRGEESHKKNVLQFEETYFSQIPPSRFKPTKKII